MASTATDSNRKTILVVDEDGPLESLSQVLKPDYNVLLADRISKALTVLETKHVDLLITGIRMPEMSGVELMESLREQYADLPIIIQSSCGDLDTAVNCIILGALRLTPIFRPPA